jgi:hypothetical protein
MGVLPFNVPQMTPKLAEIFTNIQCFAKGVRGSDDCRHHWQPGRWSRV